MLASIPSPASNGIHLGPLEVRVYGLMYLLGRVRRDRDHRASLASVRGARANSFTRSPSGPSPPG